MDLSGVSDKDLVLEIVRRIRGEDEISEFRNYCYRAAFRSLIHAYDKRDADNLNLKVFQKPDWQLIGKDIDEILKHFPSD